MFGIKHPILTAPMGPFYTAELAIAASEAGGLGVLSASMMLSDIKAGVTAADKMMELMEYVVEHTDKPFGFNIRTSRNEADAVSLSKKIPKFIMGNPKVKEQCLYALTSAGSSKTLPKSKTYQKLKESGSNIKHFHVAPALWLADKCVASGVDGMVITGGEGGGHQSYEQVSTLVLLQQVMQKYPDFPVIACGGFATGQGLAAALGLGAGAVAMGSRFIASVESEFHETYKSIIPPAKAQDTILVTGGLGLIRLWRNKYSLHHGLVASKEELMAKEAAMNQAAWLEMMEIYELAYQGNVEDGGVLIGQSIGIINSIEKVSDIIDDVISVAEKQIKKTAAYIK